MLRIATVLVSIFLQLGASAGERLLNERYFQNIEGRWLGEGSLTNSDGVVTAISEDWNGAFLEDGSFEVKGTRIWGEDQQEFYWRFTHNASLDLLECEYWHSGVENPVRFEVSLTESSVEMTSPFGEPGGELKISNTLNAEEIVGMVSLTQGNGIEAMSGEVIHRRAGGAQNE